MSDFSVLLCCITFLICFFSIIRYAKWHLKQQVSDREAELELDNEVLKNENDLLHREMQFYRTSLSDINEKGH
ncbi:MAG: hypothetical protein ACI4J0_02410 [Huintestinicola sp.]|uniref:hypothetical protein n=1 Tax=Huintestinicola sp. TaxID=2981661 RepID=UPI003F07C194